MRAMGTFLSRNWKPIATMVFAIAAAGYGAVQDVKGEIAQNTEAIEEIDRSHSKMIEATDRNVINVRYDLAQIKCMLIAEAADTDPMACIAEGEQRFEIRDQ